MTGPVVAAPSFDEAERLAREAARAVVAHGGRMTLVRDVLGRFTAFVTDEAWESGGAPRTVAEELRDRLGRYAAPGGVQPRSALPTLDDWEQDGETESLGSGPGHAVLVERTITGGDWRAATIAGHSESVRRVTMYGFKGGVGRSTATFLLAEHLARAGRCVLVVDLDLESPGVSTLLASNDQLPPHGIVDHMVESAVGSGLALKLVAPSRRVRTEGNGEVWLAPAGGEPRGGYSYVPKLNRIYTDVPGREFGSRLSFAQRLEAAVTAADEQVTDSSRRPDVVLLDSRAGVHDVAAVAITRLADLSLLFAADSPQTWRGYGELFAEWTRRPERARAIRHRLKLVAVQVSGSEDRRRESLEIYRDNAQELFAATLYDDMAEPDPDAFNPSRDDLDAPHSPLPIPHVPELVGLDPSRDGWQRNPGVDAAFEEFHAGVVRLLGPVSAP